MAVIIVNISEKNGREYGKGEQVYELRINNKRLCRFKHLFEDGLAACLRQAAKEFEYGENLRKSKQHKEN